MGISQILSTHAQPFTLPLKSTTSSVDVKAPTAPDYDLTFIEVHKLSFFLGSVVAGSSCVNLASRLPSRMSWRSTWPS